MTTKITRKITQVLSVLCVVIGASVLVYNFLFPFVYRIKEPFFEVPIKIDEEMGRAPTVPVRNDDYGEGAFGAKRKGNRIHKGLDIKAELKNPVYASKSGWARWYFIPSGYGNLIVIEHPGRWQTRYGHLDSSVIKKSQWVHQGQVIGYVGKTGNANIEGMIPHVHFEIRYKGKPLDPEKELVKRR